MHQTAYDRRHEATPDHRVLRDDEWWRRIPAWRNVDRAQFHDHRWQMRNSITSAVALAEVLGNLVDSQFVENMHAGFELAPMAVRLTPYIVSLVDWRKAVTDPLRRQFLPLASEHEPDHPMCTLDALEEQRDSVAPGLTHRYPDKALFLALDVCPVYCRYCTRSYSIGSDTGCVDKVDYRPSVQRWEQVFDYLRNATQVEDVVVSGGDVYMLNPRMLRTIGERLLDIPHIRRIRLATKGLAVMPQKILTDLEWVSALRDISDRGREQNVHVCVHTHFAHPNEITEISRKACNKLFRHGITVRNQCVLLRGVNDDVETMVRLVRRLSYVNVQPYYVYVHDMVPGVEALRTNLSDAIELEKRVRGMTAGFMTPTFVCDAIGGGGKRELHSFETYDRDRGIAVYRSPAVDPDRAFFYFDPLRGLGPALRRAWQTPDLRERMIDAAVKDVGLGWN